MIRSSVAIAVLAVLIVSVPGAAPVRARDAADLAGTWALNREQSQFPPEAGFGAAWLPTGGAGGNSGAGGGRGGRGSSGGAAGSFAAPRESEDDARRVQLLTAEVRNPSERLSIVESATSITISDDRGPRTFHPNGREEVLQVGGVPVSVVSKQEPGRLEVLYKVQAGRELRYTFQRSASEARLVVDIQFLERGRGDAVRRVYEPFDASKSAAAPAAPAATAASGGRLTGAGSSPAGQAGLPPTSGVLKETFNQQPDAELKGLTKLGVVVEELTAQAAACGLSQATIETAVAKHLTDAGFTVARNSDEDTYVYVNIITSSVSSGLCVSRYDAFLYTHTTARLSYQDKPVLIQVSLLHKGGLSGGAPAAHATGVLRGVRSTSISSRRGFATPTNSPSAWPVSRLCSACAGSRIPHPASRIAQPVCRLRFQSPAPRPRVPDSPRFEVRTGDCARRGARYDGVFSAPTV